MFPTTSPNDGIDEQMQEAHQIFSQSAVRRITVVSGQNCPACRQLENAMQSDEELKAEFGKWEVSKIVAQDHIEFVKENGIRSVPTILFYVGDEEIGRHVGYQSRGNVLAYMARL